MTDVSYQKIFTLDNLRMKNGEWFIDKTVFDPEVKAEICIGKTLSWQKLSQRVPEATFTKLTTNESIKKFVGLTFAKLKHEKVSAKNGCVIELNDDKGYSLLDIKTGRSISDSIKIEE
jgi:hypothetical protein